MIKILLCVANIGAVDSVRVPLLSIGTNRDFRKKEKESERWTSSVRQCWSGNETDFAELPLGRSGNT